MNRLHKHMCKHYHTYSLVANGLTAMAVAGLALLGVLNGVLTAAAMLAWGVLFALIYTVGKWLDQEVEDIDKVIEHSNNDSSEDRCGNHKEPNHKDI